MNTASTASAPNEHVDEQPALSIIMPAYNEGAAIGPVLDTVSELARIHNWEVIVIDDGSDDNTAKQVEQRANCFLKLIRHPFNRGYGASIKTGIRHANSELVMTMDSDGQHDPQDILKLLPYAEQYDLVVGQRPGLVHSQIWRMPGKWVLTWLANYLTGQKIPDLNSGLRLFRTEVIKKYMHLCPDGFSFSTTSTLAFFNRGHAVYYEPITIRQRQANSNSMVSIGTGFETLILILRLASLFEPLRLFIPASATFVVLGLLWGLPFIIRLRGVSVAALLLILTGLLLFFFGLLTDQVAQMRLEKYE